MARIRNNITADTDYKRTVSPTSVAFVKGWNDAKVGLPFRREYDGWPFRLQRNYEMGRSEAVVAMRLGPIRKQREDQQITTLPRRVTPSQWLAMQDEMFFHAA